LNSIQACGLTLLYCIKTFCDDTMKQWSTTIKKLIIKNLVQTSSSCLLEFVKGCLPDCIQWVKGPVERKTKQAGKLSHFSLSSFGGTWKQQTATRNDQIHKRLCALAAIHALLTFANYGNRESERKCLHETISKTGAYCEAWNVMQVQKVC